MGETKKYGGLQSMTAMLKSSGQFLCALKISLIQYSIPPPTQARLKKKWKMQSSERLDGPGSIGCHPQLTTSSSKNKMFGRSELPRVAAASDVVIDDG